MTRHSDFNESQVYRIDHYLGKETVQNLLAFRFSNTIFESLWNRDRIEQVEITVAEELDIGKRAIYYEQAGALRDMVQNHLTQLLALIAMEAPVAFDADAIRYEKIKALRSLAPIRPDDVIFGQYASGKVNGKEVHGYKQEVHIYPDIKSLSLASAEEITRCINIIPESKDFFTIAMAGGHTPAMLYKLLSEKYITRILWQKVHIFWGDERYVPHEHPESNYAMVYKTLISKVPLPAENIHPIPIDLSSPDDAAIAYERMLREFFSQRGMSTPCFDLFILGVGEDGHTASLFPGDRALREVNRWVVPVSAPKHYSPQQRITLTLKLINSSENVFFIAAGSKKRNIVQSILEDVKTARNVYPAAMVQPKGRVIWFVDEMAYAKRNP